MARPEGYVALVLHAHLPFVRHPEQTAFLEEDWLHHAIAECYVPLLDTFEALFRDGVPFRVTLSLSPTLCAMLRDPLLISRFEARLGRLIDVSAHLPPDLAAHYQRRLGRVSQRMATEGSDLVGAFARIAGHGRLELMAVSATHAVLPLLGTTEARSAQICVGLESQERHFGRRPGGLWLAECAWDDDVDVLIHRSGIRHVVLETAALAGARPAPRAGPAAPILTPGGVAAFARDPDASRRVWSASQGYPGDPVYREFHRDFGRDADPSVVASLLSDDRLRRPIGLKCHRVTGAVGLAEKAAYEPEAAARRAAEHARDFLAGRVRFIREAARRLDRPPLVVAPFDAELFGHWWYEGPIFIEALFRAAADEDAPVRFVTLSEYLDEHGPGQRAAPAASTWGAGSDLRTWLHEGTSWMLREAHRAEDRMLRLCGRRDPAPGSTRALRQAGRELLLSQASDWGFLVTAGTSASYAEQRFREHVANVACLADAIEADRVDEASLSALEARHNLFPWLDPSVWRGG